MLVCQWDVSLLLSAPKSEQKRHVTHQIRLRRELPR